MIEDDFYSTIKLKCGDEIFCKVAPTDEGDRTLLIVHNPITVEEIKIRGKVTGYSFEPWLKTTKDDMFIINLEDVLTMSECNDIEMIKFYQDYVRKANKSNFSKLNRKMGYISTVHEAKEILEKLYKLDSRTQ